MGKSVRADRVKRGDRILVATGKGFRIDTVVAVRKIPFMADAKEVELRLESGGVWKLLDREPVNLAGAALGALGASESSFFADQDVLVDQIREIADAGEADDENFDPSQEYAASGVRDTSENYIAKRVAWLGSPGHMVKISAECIRFTPENEWNLAHAAAVYQAIRAADPSEPIRLRPPAGRVYRIDAARVKTTAADPSDWGMVRGFTRAYLGEYMVQLLDGNHRASAAIAAGEPFIYAFCGEDYLPNVKPGDLK